MMRFNIAVLILALFSWAGFANAQDGRASSDDQFDLLERQIRSVKTDLLDLEADMLRLQRDARFSESERWTLYLTGPDSDNGRLYSVVVSVNGAVVASHNYSEMESQALTQGGAHKLYTGALAPGQHNVNIQAQDHLGQRAAAYQVEKVAGAQILNLKWNSSAGAGTRPFEATSLADRN